MITQGSLVRNQPDPPSHMSPIDGCKEVDEWQSNACRGSFGIEATHPTSFWFWGCSSAGRAAALQAVGSGFESCHLHQSFKKVSKLKRSKQDIEARYRDNNLSHIEGALEKGEVNVQHPSRFGQRQLGCWSGLLDLQTTVLGETLMQRLFFNNL